MANAVLNHAFVSAKADGADATLIRPGNWNAGHKWTGGSNNDLMTRDSVATDGASWNALATVLAFMLTTRGDIITRQLAGVARLALGATKQYLKSDGTDAAWAYVTALQESGATVLDLGAIADGQILKRSGTTITSQAPPIFTKSFESAEQAIVTNTSTAVAHGLGAVPKLTQLLLRCKTTDLGYAVGDEVPILGIMVENNSGGYGTSISADATNITISSGTDQSILTKNGAAYGAITHANWKYVVRAWA